MIKYNWEKILRETKGDSVSILTIIHLLTYKRIPASRKDKTYKYFGKSFLGDSFLCNPRELLVQRRYYSIKKLLNILQLIHTVITLNLCNQARQH